MVCCKISFTIWISQAVLYQENVSKADQNCVSDFTYIPLESIQKEKSSLWEKKILPKKCWKEKEVEWAIYGIENQSNVKNICRFAS